ncbi:hypothetical protein [Antarcticirhabdus aurantiaca]|uniref:Uncharacterized protein n=1 Tax=Antarcticirhabdus aurantiaca TaxID=2606717 RepID=A0ACD4NHX0_9HYPH|nr:hypothetical protein [Antarcticirhabdus aurantiaca]WAJ26397.1 hypothetical protein OXU80_16010 [Jeongeuplla avenae]
MPSDVRRTVLIGIISRSLGVAGDRHSVLTPTRLKERMEAFGLYSARQVDAYLARLVATGFIEITPHPDDRRVRAIRPLEPLGLWHAAMLDLYFHPLQLLFPNPAFDLILKRDVEFLPVLGRISTDEEALATARLVLGHDPDYTALISRGSGGLLVNAVLKHLSDTGRAEMEEATIVALGTAIGRSRSHLRNLLTAAIEAGFMERAGAKGQVLRILPRLVTTAERFFADSLRTYEYTFGRAERAYRQG